MLCLIFLKLTAKLINACSDATGKLGFKWNSLPL